MTITYQNIPLSQIALGDKVIRNERENIEGLAQSIKEVGLLHPLTVKKLGETYQMISGMRRYLAFLLLNKEDSNHYNEIPCQVTESQTHPTILSLSENIQRESLTPFEEAEAIYSLIEITSKNYKEIGILIGKSEDYVEKRIRYLRLLRELKSRIAAFFPDDNFLKRFNRVEVSKILLLKPLISHYKPEEAYELLVRMVKENLSQREIKSEIQSYHDNQMEKRMGHQKDEEEILEIFSELGLEGIPIEKTSKDFKRSQLKLNEKKERNQKKKRLKHLYTEAFWEKLISLIRESLHLTIFHVHDFQKAFQRLILRMGESFITN